MMIDVRNRLIDNNLSREELLQNVEIVSTSYDDAEILTDLMSRSFNMPKMVALRQLIYSKARLDKSVKLIDRRNGDIYGFLIFSDFKLFKGSPILHLNAKLGGFLIQFKQLNGFSFIIDERLRGTGIDKDMLLFQKDFIDEYEMIWAAVERDFKTHTYWKRLGFVEAFSIPEATFYVMFNDKMVSDNIYSIIDKLKDENHYS